MRSKADSIRALTAPGAPYALDQRADPGTARFENAPRSLADVVLEAERHGDRPFLVFEEERIAYADAIRQARNLAAHFRDDLGLVPGDRVGIAMRNYPEWVVTFLACVSAGLVAVAANGWWNEAQLDAALRRCAVGLIVADAERAARVERLAGDGVRLLVARDAAGRTADFERACGGDRALPLPPPGGDDPATIIFTSGSEREPKGVVSSHGALIHAMFAFELNYYADCRLGPEDWADDPLLRAAQDRRPGATLLAIPLFHINGLLLGMMRALRGGKKLVLMRKWDAVQALDLIDREGIQLFPAVPTVTGDLVAAARERGRSLPSLRFIGGGGAARSTTQVRALAGLNPDISPYSGWGMTETNALGTAIGGADYQARPRAAGRALPGVALQVVDAAGQALPTGEPGELLIRTPALFSGYWRDPAATAAAFLDGWLRTGDVATIDADGFVTIVDRIKQIIIRGGENISCSDIEDAAAAHPRVAEAAAVPVDDARLGEAVGLVASIGAGQALATEDLMAFLRQRLSGVQLPSLILILAEPLPRLPVGKVDRQACRRLLNGETEAWHDEG